MIIQPVADMFDTKRIRKIFNNIVFFPTEISNLTVQYPFVVTTALLNFSVVVLARLGLSYRMSGLLQKMFTVNFIQNVFTFNQNHNIQSPNFKQSPRQPPPGDYVAINKSKASFI